MEKQRLSRTNTPHPEFGQWAVMKSIILSTLQFSFGCCVNDPVHQFYFCCLVYRDAPHTHNIRTYRCVDGGRRGRRQCAPFLRGYLPVDVDDLVPRESGTAQTRSKKRRRYVKKKEIAVRPLDRSITHTLPIIIFISGLFSFCFFCSIFLFAITLPFGLKHFSRFPIIN